MTLVSAGRVGKAHGHDGSFYLERASEPLQPGTEVTVSGTPFRIDRLAGTESKPLVRLSGVGDREAAIALRGETLLVDGKLEAGEWLAAELVGCEVPGLGRVTRIVGGPSCDVLELEDGTLVPFVSDAVRLVDPDARRIEVDLGFLGRA